jgi:hypothetical protein
MKARRKRRAVSRPLIEPLVGAIARDARNKMALDKQFWRFYRQMKQTIRGNRDLKNLEVPLEEVKEAVKDVAYGFVFGTPLVTVTKQKDWEG